MEALVAIKLASMMQVREEATKDLQGSDEDAVWP